MSFYDLSKEDRIKRVEQISIDLLANIKRAVKTKFLEYFSDEDTYIRKSAYLAIGKIYNDNKDLQTKVIKILDELLREDDAKIRQTVINSAGEIGIKRFLQPLNIFSTRKDYSMSIIQ